MSTVGRHVPTTPTVLPIQQFCRPLAATPTCNAAYGNSTPDRKAPWRRRPRTESVRYRTTAASSPGAAGTDIGCTFRRVRTATEEAKLLGKTFGIGMDAIRRYFIGERLRCCFLIKQKTLLLLLCERATFRLGRRGCSWKLGRQRINWAFPFLFVHGNISRSGHQRLLCSLLPPF